MRRRTRRRLSADPALVASLVGAMATGLVTVGPTLRPGYVLFLDNVTVPSPIRPTWESLSTTAGLRAWPLDGVVWAWSQVLPSWTFQQAVLLAALLGAGVGAGLLLRRWGWIASLSASVLAIANPYVGERLLLGQVVLLLAYASLPWIAVASRQATSGSRVVGATLASVPAALTPWGALLAGSAAVSAAIVRRRSLREVATQAGLSIGLCLPWLVPTLIASAGAADSAGAEAFRLAREGRLPALIGSLVGGGVWSSSAQVLDGQWPLVGAALMVALAAIGWWRLMRSRHDLRLVSAVVALSVPLVTALLSRPLLGMWAAAQEVPGAALFRDLHRLLAPSILALVLLVALGTDRVVRLVGRDVTRPRMVLGMVLPASLASLVFAGVPGRVHATYAPDEFSGEWDRVVAALADDGRVLSVPWQPLRTADWRATTFLDPTNKAVGHRVISDTALTVEREGLLIRVEDGSADRPLPDTLVRRLTEPLSDPVPSSLLSGSNITRILVWKDSAGFVPTLPEDGLELIFNGSHFAVWAADDDNR